MSRHATVLSLYKQILRESSRFTSYYYRSYSLRKARDEFRKNINVQDLKRIDELIETAEKNLAMLKRQVTINQLYKSDKLVIE